MLIKLYGHAPDGQRRYNPPEIIGIDKIACLDTTTIHPSCVAAQARNSFRFAVSAEIETVPLPHAPVDWPQA